MDKKGLILKLQKTPEIWKVKLFEEKDFKRKQCRKCGKFFWSLTSQETCNDSSCKPYEFLGNPLTNKKYDYFEAWKSIKKFFLDNNHNFLERYPVVCRWFPNLYFTIAGIVDFYRMNGDKFVFEFPTNPIIMLQPSLRFNDIPQVGISGRHWTCHSHVEQAVLSNKKGYWKDECIDLDFELLTNIFGIKPELINFIEDAWLGPGAFGYSLEYHVQGLELGNAVFTEFSGTPENYTVMKEKVIDMGAGLERFCWISQGTSTSYDAVLGNVIEKMKKASEIKYDKEFFLRYSKLAGLLNIDEVPDIEIARTQIAKQLGVSKQELKEKIEPLEAIYAIADHVKALCFAISDNAIPSNVGGGYNLRVILRRALSFINEFNFPFDLQWIAEETSKYLKPLHPELLENIDKINDLLEIEYKKYKETVERTRKTIEVFIEKKTKFTNEKLVELYDSHGITPELLEKVVKIDIPADFYAKVTEKHMQEKPIKEKETIDVSGKPETRKLYYENEKLFEFQAKVLKINDKYVVLNQTAFYPRGGGQEPDFGTINGLKVFDVERIGDVIIHVIENPKFKVGETVKCKIDSKRRDQITKHHTATHIINGAARRVLGNHVWQAGSKKDVDKAHLDITHYETLTEKQIEKIEKIANEIIKKNIKISKEVLPRMEAERKYGFRIYQGGAVPESELRIIKSGDFDVEACGGLHVNNTKEIEEVFIFNSKRIQDGIIRLEYIAGKDLVKKTRKEFEQKRKIEKHRLEEKIAKIQKEKKKLEKIREKTKLLYGINFIETEDMKELETIARESIKVDQTKYSILVGKGVVFGISGKNCKFDIENTVKKIAKLMGGSAGGYGNEFKGGGPNKDIEIVKKYFSKK